MGPLLGQSQIFEVIVIVLKYIPEDLVDIKPLLHSFASKCVASRYEQAPKYMFQPLDFGNKKPYYIEPQYA